MDDHAAPPGDGALTRFIEVLAQQHAHNELLWTISETISELLGLDDFVLYIAEGHSLMQAAAFGVKTPRRCQLLDPIGIPLGHAIVGRAGESRTTIYVPDIAKAQREGHLGYVSDHVAGRSELTVPVVVDDELVAILDTESEIVDGYASWQIQTLERMAAAVGPRILLWRHQRDRHALAEQARGRQARALGTFAGSLAHDLNNLLSVVELNAELLRRDPYAGDQVQDALSRAVHRARALTGRLITLTSKGQASLDIIDVPSMLHEAATAAGLMPNIEVTLAIEDDLPLLRADPVQVPHIVMNLMVNAIEAIGSRRGTVTLRAWASDGEPPLVHIDVVDDGVGIAPETRAHIFDPYFTTKPNGAGLGLASSYWAALQHGGDLKVTSEPGEGATFSLTLPGQSGRLVLAPPRPPSVGHLRLLVLDDDLLLGEVLSDILDHLGHRHELVRRGEEVIPAWLAARHRGEPFDVALLDLRNELGMGGSAALEALRQVDPSVRAVAMSGYADRTLEEARHSGFTETLSKPFQVAELVRALSLALGRVES